MSLFGICALALTAAVGALILKEWKGQGLAIAVGVTAVCVIGAAALSKYSDALEMLGILAERDAAVSDAAALVLRALGVSFVAQIGAELCRDLGENSVASVVEAVGRAEILLICLPEFISLVNKAVEMIG